MVLPQFLFAVHSMFSGQMIYFDGFYQVYNIFYTGLPILVFGIFDQDVSAKGTLANPKMYKEGPRGSYFNHRVFWCWMTEAFIEAACLLFFSFAAYGNGVTFGNGMSSSLFDNGSLVFLAVVHTVTVRLFLEVGE